MKMVSAYWIITQWYVEEHCLRGIPYLAQKDISLSPVKVTNSLSLTSNGSRSYFVKVRDEGSQRYV